MGVSTEIQSRHETYGRRGDIIYWATLLNTLVFCGCVLFLKDNPDLFDSVWAKDGFCVSNPTVPYFTSHDLCLYVDLAVAAVIGFTYYKLHEEDGMEPANVFIFPNMIGIAMHGFGHGGIGKGLRDEEDILELDLPYFATIGDKTWGETLWGMVLDQGGYLVFWLLLLKAAMPQSNMMRAVLPVAIFSWLGALCIKASFQFTFVQTVLLIAFAINQLCRPKEEKGFAYLMYGAFGFPVAIVGWLESTMCSSIVIQLGGHLLYDGYIAVSALAFYLTCYVYRGLETAKIKTD